MRSSIRNPGSAIISKHVFRGGRVARTRLLTAIQQLYRKFEEAEISGTPDLPRRDFLKVSGTVAAATILGTKIGFAAPQNPHIVIIGGGISGLHAALTLQDAGLSSTIYDAAHRIGGRIRSDTKSWRNNQVSEHYGELIDASHKTILSLAKRFNIPTADVTRSEPPQSTETFHFFGKYYSPRAAGEEFKAVYAAVKKDLLAVGYPVLYNSFTSAASKLDNLSVYDWIETRIEGGHRSAIGQLVDVACNLEFGAETKTQSALNLIFIVGQTSSAGGVFGGGDRQFHLAGGNERLPKAIAAALPAGNIKMGTSLTSILRNSDGSYTLGLKRGGTAFVEHADRVILALPFSVLRRLDYQAAGFNSVKRTAIQELGYGTNSKLHLQFNRRLWNKPGPWGVSSGTSFSDRGYQGTWDVTRAQSGATGILVNYTSGETGASYKVNSGNPLIARTYAMQFLDKLEPVFPGISLQWNRRASLDTPSQSPFFLGSYSYWKVGQYTSIAGAERERSGNCHFAGEHCSIDFQGLMEGAAQEGARAASEIMADYRNSAAR